MKRAAAFLVVAVVGLFILAGCSSGPSPEDIDATAVAIAKGYATAEAQALTATAEAIPTDTQIPEDTATPRPTETPVPTDTIIPTDTPTPTRIPLSSIDLEPLFIQSGDLPGHLRAGQISDLLMTQSIRLENLEAPANFLNQKFEHEQSRRVGGSVIVYLYEDASEASKAYTQVKSGFSPGGFGSEVQVDVGENSYGYWSTPQRHTIYTRCNAFVYVWMVDASESEILAYARRLDERLSPFICRDQ